MRSCLLFQSFEEIRRSSKIGPYIEPDTSTNYSSVWPLWPKDKKIGQILPFYLSDSEENSFSSSDDDADVVHQVIEDDDDSQVVHKVIGKPIKDEFDEIIIKSQRCSSSDGINRLTRPLTGHPRRRARSAVKSPPESPNLSTNENNNKLVKTQVISPIFNAYGSLPMPIDSYLKYSSNFYNKVLDWLIFQNH